MINVDHWKFPIHARAIGANSINIFVGWEPPTNWDTREWRRASSPEGEQFANVENLENQVSNNYGKADWTGGLQTLRCGRCIAILTPQKASKIQATQPSPPIDQLVRLKKLPTKCRSTGFSKRDRGAWRRLGMGRMIGKAIWRLLTRIGEIHDVVNNTMFWFGVLIVTHLSEHFRILAYGSARSTNLILRSLLY